MTRVQGCPRVIRLALRASPSPTSSCLGIAGDYASILGQELDQTWTGLVEGRGPVLDQVELADRDGAECGFRRHRYGDSNPGFRTENPAS